MTVLNLRSNTLLLASARLAALALAVALSGCATSNANRLSLTTMAVTPPSLMVAKKSPRTVYLVLDPAKVAAEVPVLVGGEDRGGKLTDVQQFVQRDLKKALSTYFDEVQVIAPGQPMGTRPHVVVDVKLDRVEVLVSARRNSGIMTYTAGSAAVTWGFGLRPSESNEYLYSFAGESVGSASEDPTFVFRTMFESAIGDLLKGYTDKHIHQLVLDLPAPPPASATQL